MENGVLFQNYFKGNCKIDAIFSHKKQITTTTGPREKKSGAELTSTTSQAFPFKLPFRMLLKGEDAKFEDETWTGKVEKETLKFPGDSAGDLFGILK